MAAAIDPSVEMNKLPTLNGCPSGPSNPAMES
jgi:hypothetical protein